MDVRWLVQAWPRQEGQKVGHPEVTFNTSPPQANCTSEQECDVGFPSGRRNGVLPQSVCSSIEAQGFCWIQPQKHWRKCLHVFLTHSIYSGHSLGKPDTDNKMERHVKSHTNLNYLFEADPGANCFNGNKQYKWTDCGSEWIKCIWWPMGRTRSFSLGPQVILLW